MQKYMDNLTEWIVPITGWLLVVVAVVYIVFVRQYPVARIPSPTPLQPVMCTMEAKLCPDGSYVGRTGPHCEFAPCPGGGNFFQY